MKKIVADVTIVNGVKLLPCPFCGNDTLILGTNYEIHCISLTFDELEDIDYTVAYAVCCDFKQGGCGASSGYRDTEAEAIVLWNKRHKLMTNGDK